MEREYNEKKCTTLKTFPTFPINNKTPALTGVFVAGTGLEPVTFGL
jgi:hypothetical protein